MLLAALLSYNSCPWFAALARCCYYYYYYWYCWCCSCCWGCWCCSVVAVCVCHCSSVSGCRHFFVWKQKETNYLQLICAIFAIVFISKRDRRKLLRDTLLLLDDLAAEWLLRKESTAHRCYRCYSLSLTTSFDSYSTIDSVLRECTKANCANSEINRLLYYSAFYSKKEQHFSN